MNIFYLHRNPIIAAQYYCDKHVVKMILESVQILSTVANFYGIEAPYKPTHKNHPCVVWAKYRWEHFQFLHELCCQLNNEYIYRYNHGNHKSYEKLIEYDLLNKMVKVMPVDCNFTAPPQVMPDEFKRNDTVDAYRAYYASGKQHLHKWTNREAPKWLSE